MFIRDVVEIDDLGARNLSFMRAFLDRDLSSGAYFLEWPVFTDVLANLIEGKTSTQLVTTIDYSSGRPRKFIASLDGLRDGDNAQHVNWDEHSARLARSHGRMDLHLMIIRDFAGKGPVRGRRIMFPQHSDGPSLHDGFLRIFKQPGDLDAQLKAMEELLEANESVVKIH
jgi:hypothetical protein